MSETNIGPTVPQQPGPQAEQRGGSPSQQPAPAAPAAPTAASSASTTRRAEPTGWVGWIAFAAIMAMLVGFFHMFQGFVALVSKDYYAVTSSGLTIHMSYTTWGWIHLIVGAVLLATGIGIVAGQMWARVVGIALAALSAIVNVAFLAAFPVWSSIMIAFDVLVIWALTVHGREMKTIRDEQRYSYE